MTKRKGAKTYEQEKENSPLAQQPAQVRQENLDRDVAVDGEDIEGGRSISHAILRLGQTYGNRYVRNLIGDGGKVGKQTQGRIEAQRGYGQPLDAGLLSDLEMSFNRDLGDVRVHKDREAAALAVELDAQAFTTGKDIFFADNAYQPGTGQGMTVLRHELAHVAQQGEDMAVMPSVLTQPGDKVEQDAAAAENADSWAPASMLPVGVVARIGGSTPEAPISTNMPSSPSSTQASDTGSQTASTPNAPGANQRSADQRSAEDEERARRRGEWQGKVIDPSLRTQDILAGGELDSGRANQAIGALDQVLTGISSMMPNFEGQPFYTALQRDYNAVQVIRVSLSSYANTVASPGDIILLLSGEKDRLVSMSSEL